MTPGDANLSDQFDGFDYPYLYVSRDVLSNGTVSISLTTTHVIAYYKSHYKAKLLVNRSVTVAGWPGRLLIFSGVDNGLKLLFQQINIARGRVGYFIEMSSAIETPTAGKALFSKIYATFRRR